VRTSAAAKRRRAQQPKDAADTPQYFTEALETNQKRRLSLVLALQRRQKGRTWQRTAVEVVETVNQTNNKEKHMEVIERPIRSRDIAPGFSPKPAKRPNRRFVMDDPAPSPSPSPEPRTQDPNGIRQKTIMARRSRNLAR